MWTEVGLVGARDDRKTKGDGVDDSVVLDVRAQMSAGLTDAEICKELSLSAEEVREARKRVVAEELTVVGPHRPADEVFIEYRLQMNRIVKDLDDVSTKAKKKENFQAAFGALKAQATILDKVIDRGQEMGVIPRASKRSTVMVAGVFIGSMTDSELIASMKEFEDEARRLRKDYGDVPLAELPDPDLYVGPIDVEFEKQPEPEKVRVNRRKA